MTSPDPTSPGPSTARAARRAWTAEEARSAGLIELGVRPPLGLYLSELWRRREFAWLIPLGDLRARHMHTVLGGLWHLLNPILLAIVYFLVFGLILQLHRDIDNYPAFLVAGLFVFYYTQKSMQQGARTVVNDVKLLRNVNFPRAILPISAVLSETLAHLPAVLTMLAFMLVTGQPLRWTWLLLVPYTALQLVMNLGFAFFTSRLTVHFRDTEQFLPFVVRLWFYFSGVIFPITMVPEGWPRTLFALNPVYAFIHLTRSALGFEESVGGLPSWLTETGFLGLAVGWAVVIFLAGFLFFYSHESEYSRATG